MQHRHAVGQRIKRRAGYAREIEHDRLRKLGAAPFQHPHGEPRMLWRQRQPQRRRRSACALAGPAPQHAPRAALSRSHLQPPQYAILVRLHPAERGAAFRRAQRLFVGPQRFGSAAAADDDETGEIEPCRCERRRQTYQNLVPLSVQVYNTPERDRFTQNYGWGIFGQDTWRVNRMSVSVGLRWDAFQSSIAAESSGQGVFVPERTFGPEEMPPWKNLEPRFSVTYDVSGDGKTAVKFSANKYVLSATNGIAAALNPMRLQSSSLNWTDLNGDDIAQGARGCTYLTPGCEMNFAQLPATFGLITPGCTTIYSEGSIPCGTDQADPNIKRDTEHAYAVGVQHELFPRFALNGGYYYTRFYNLRQTNNLLQTFGDYTPVQVASPLDGSVVTVYNVSAAKQASVRNLQTSSDTAKMWNHSFEVGFNARLPHSASVFGGVSTDRTLAVQCDVTDNPNRLLYCDQTKSGIPFNTQFKIAGSFPLPWSLQGGASFQTYKYLFGTGAPLLTFAGSTVWQITRTTRYDTDCKGPCTPGGLVNPNQTAATLNVPLEPQGTQPSGRINQLDLTVGRWVTFGAVRFKPEVSLFNALNNRATLTFRSQNYLTPAFLQPSEVLQPRLVRIGVQVNW